MPAPINLSWTPQQDLEGEEESSSEGGLNPNKIYNRSTTTNVKFSPRSQVFSLSLPRDNHLAAYMEEKVINIINVLFCCKIYSLIYIIG